MFVTPSQKPIEYTSAPTSCKLGLFSCRLVVTGLSGFVYFHILVYIRRFTLTTMMLSHREQIKLLTYSCLIPFVTGKEE